MSDVNVDVYEFWYRDPITGWIDHWWEVPELELKYGDKFPMCRNELSPAPHIAPMARRTS